MLSDPAPTPNALQWRLTRGGWTIAILSYGLGAAAAPLALNLQDRSLAACSFFFLTLLLCSAFEASVSAALAMQRISPLFRALNGGQRDGSTPPPSESALRDAFAAPWIGACLGVVGAMPVIVAQALQWVGGVVDASSRLPLAMLACAISLLGFSLRLLLWRKVLWEWLARVRPADVQLPFSSSMVFQVMAQLLLPVCAVCLGAAAVLTSRCRDPLAVVSVALVGAAAVLWTAWRAQAYGKAISSDLRGVAGRVRTLTEARSDPSLHEATAALVKPFRTAAAASLARAVHSLTLRYAELASEEMRACTAVEEAQRLKARFMACMSHDLRSPLNAIQGFADLLQSGAEGPLNAAQSESLEMIRQSGAGLLFLIEEILDWAKLEVGRLELQRQWTPLVEIINAAVERAQKLNHQKDAKRIITELQAGLPPLQVDGARVSQALVGVLHHCIQLTQGEGSLCISAKLAPGSQPVLPKRPGKSATSMAAEDPDNDPASDHHTGNARTDRPVDHTRVPTTLPAPRSPQSSMPTDFPIAAPRVAIAVAANDRPLTVPPRPLGYHVRIEVTYDNHNLRTPSRERVLAEFQQLESASDQRWGALGLGLALSRSLIVAHRGELWYEWQRPQGTVFCIALPIE